MLTSVAFKLGSSQLQSVHADHWTTTITAPAKLLYVS